MALTAHVMIVDDKGFIIIKEFFCVGNNSTFLQ